MKAFYFLDQNCKMILADVKSGVNTAKDNDYINVVITESSFRMETIIVIAAILSIIALVALLLLLLTAKSRKRKALERKFSEYECLVHSIESKMRLCAEELIKVKKNDEKVRNADAIDTSLKGMTRYNDIVNNLEIVRTDLKEANENVRLAKKNRSNVKASLSIMTDACKKLSKTEKWLDRVIPELREANRMDRNRLANVQKSCISENHDEDTVIRYDLSVSEISSLKGASGMMSATDFAGKYSRTSYRMDDIPLLGRTGTLGSDANLGPIDLVVSGFNNGLLLRGTDEFRIRQAAGENVKTRRAELQSGNTYELKIHTDRGNVSMKLAVQ